MLLRMNYQSHSDMQPGRTTSCILQSMYAFLQSISVPDLIGLTPRTLFLLTQFFSCSNSPQWAWASSSSSLHDHTQTHHTRQYSSGLVISSTQIPIPDIRQHSQQADIPVAGRIRTRIPRKIAAAGLRLRRHGHWDRPAITTQIDLNPYVPYNVFNKTNLIKNCKFFDDTLPHYLGTSLDLNVCVTSVLLLMI
jgi:hypothetical protein